MQMMVSFRNFITMVSRHIYILLLTGTLFASVTKKIIESDQKHLIIQIDIDVKTEADLRPTSFIVGFPTLQLPITNIQYLNKSTLPFTSQQELIPDFEWINRQELQNLQTGTIRISSLYNSTEYFKTILLTLEFDNQIGPFRQPNKTESALLKNRIVNWDDAQHWIKRKSRSASKSKTIPDGRWVQFYLNIDGMISIPYSSLSTIIPDLSSVDPRSFSIFMSSEFGRSRTMETNQEMTENLVEIGIWVEGEMDGVFNSADKIVFYGRGASGFDLEDDKLKWHQNIYFNSNSCWLFIPNDSNERGKRVLTVSQPESVTLTLDYGIASVHHETDLINLKASGTEWVGSPILSGGSQALLVQLKNPKVGVDSDIIARFRGHSLSESLLASHILSLHHGNVNGDQIGSSASWSGTGTRNISDNSPDISLNNGSNVFYIKNSSSNGNSSPYLDYFEIDYGRALTFADNYDFTSPVVGQDVRFTLSGNQSESEYLWDISDLANPTLLVISDAGFVNISLSGDSLSRFTLFDTNTLPIIVDLELKDSQEFTHLRNLGIQVDYIMIGPNEFQNELNDLGTLRSPAIFAGIETIYNEFSAGNKDPMAIRSFVQWTQEFWLSPQPKYLLIVGDGGYDYRNITGQSSIIIPTVQVQSSRTYATDDLLAAVYGNIPEVALGRFPAKNVNEVATFVEKVMELESNPDLGPWRQQVTLIADDAARPEPLNGSIATGKSHTLNTEELAEIVSSSIYTNKLYMMEFPEESDASAYGVIKPAATQALFDYINSGTAIISYIGHGSPYQLAQENLLNLGRGDINQMNTGMKMPLWIVGTCSFGHFDDPFTESFAEELIRAPMNAASMVISTTRPITVSGNERYTKDLFEAIFENNRVSDTPVGILLQSIKDGSSEGQFFHLFGDPAMQLPMPKENISLSGISPDTLKTLETGIFNGSQNLVTHSGNGFVTLIDADRPITREYQIYSDTYSLSYTLPGATLFRGQFSVDNENFTGDIRIPQDISYSTDPAKLMIYIHNDEIDAVGVLQDIQLIGGEGTSDIFGPTISFETISGRILEYGDHFPENENLIIRFSDPLGINLTNEIGHEIQVTDSLTKLSEFITNDFYYDQNSIQTGTIEYQTSTGRLVQIKIKAWDNANNPSEKEIKLLRTENQDLRIFNTYNYPNPFSTSTQFTFEITNSADIQLDIYTLGGRRIISMEKFFMSPGYHTIDWDGLDSYGGQIANGVYLYRLKAMGDKTTETYIGRCAKYR
jgi:hypothetical protein